MSSGANRRAALAALDRGRGALGKLGSGNSPQERREALRQSWGATEVALRALLGGSPLAGQPLVRALREEGLLTLEQAHALVDVAAASERAGHEAYEPTETDAESARSGFRMLDDALNEAAEIEARRMADLPPKAEINGAGTTAGAPAAAAPGESRRRSFSVALVALLALLLVIVPLGGWWYWSSYGSVSAKVEAAARMYSSGDRDGARVRFEQLARDNPNEVMPHVYLGRIARDNGDMAAANRELQAAIRLDPNSPVALREMGSFMLASGEPDVARRFYVRALTQNPADSTSMGFLGCALSRLGRVQEAATWLQRAGPGAWSQCAGSPAPAVAPMLR